MIDQIESWALAMVTGTGVNPAQVMLALRDRFDGWLESPLDAGVNAEEGLTDLDRLHRFLGVA